jgi:hypothetical protein
MPLFLRRPSSARCNTPVALEDLPAFAQQLSACPDDDLDARRKKRGSRDAEEPAAEFRFHAGSADAVAAIALAAVAGTALSLAQRDPEAPGMQPSDGRICRSSS